MRKLIVKRINRFGKKITTILALGMVLNIGIFLVSPKAITPVYQAINGIMHNKIAAEPRDLYIMFDKITSFLPREHKSKLRLRMVQSPRINAWVDGTGTVTVTSAFLEFNDYDSGRIAFVLGHEVAHYILGHTHVEDSDDIQSVEHSAYRESMADYMGLLLAKSAGYNACNGLEFFKKMESQFGYAMFPTSHPLAAYRVKTLEALCKRLI